MQSPTPVCLDGGFFFPSSPLFGAQHHPSEAQQLDSPHSASDAPEHDFVGDMLFAHHPPVVHQQTHQMYEQHPAKMAPHNHNQLLTEPFQQTHTHAPPMQQHLDWQHAAESMPIQLPQVEQLQHEASYSSRSSSSGSSGHSTPTLVASTPPAHQDQQQQAQQTHQFPTHHEPTHQVASSTASVSSASSVSSPPSLLDQLSCTIPASSMDGLFTTGTSGSGAKPKRKSVKKEKATSANASVATLSPQTSHQQHHLQQQHQQQPLPLPVFVGAPAPLHMDALSVPQHLLAPPLHSSSSYVSPPSTQSPRASSPYFSSSLSPSNQLVENNEPHPLDDEETKKRKLARKAELARLSRKRKKTRLTDLEAEVRRLEDELARAKKSRFDRDQATAAAEAGASASASSTADALSKQKMGQVIGAMSSAVHSGLARCSTGPSSSRGPILTGSDACRPHPSALTPLIEEFMVQYNNQAANCNNHLATLQEYHVKPLRTFDFLAALMKQPHDCPTSSRWSQLVQAELELAPSSREFGELEGFRQSSASQHNFDAEIERAFSKLQGLFQKRATQHGKNLNRIRSIFSEEQFVKYIEWSHRQGAAQVHKHAHQHPHQQMDEQAAYYHASRHQQQPSPAHEALTHYAHAPSYAPMYDAPLVGHAHSHMAVTPHHAHAAHHLAIKVE